MFVNHGNKLKQAAHTAAHIVCKEISVGTKPTRPSLVLGSLSDLVRTKPQLITENALLRQQLIVLNRSVKRPGLTPADRSLLMLLASRVRAVSDQGEECLADCPTRHVAALASLVLPIVLETEVALRSACTEDRSGDHYLDQGHGRQ